MWHKKDKKNGFSVFERIHISDSQSKHLPTYFDTRREKRTSNQLLAIPTLAEKI